MDLTKRQNEIIEVSINLIAQGGIQNLTIKNISHSMNISEPAIYRHFNSKLDILLAIIDKFISKSQALFKDINAREISSIEKIEELFKLRYEEFIQNPQMATVIFSEEIFQNEKILVQKVLDSMNLHQKMFLELIEKAQSDNQIRKDIPKEHIALIIMGSLRLIVTKWRLSGFSFDLAENGSKVWNSLGIVVKEK